MEKKRHNSIIKRGAESTHCVYVGLPQKALARFAANLERLSTKIVAPNYVYEA